MDYLELENENAAKIKVVGAGGGGGNAINNMINSALKGVTFIAANTDVQALNKSSAEFKIQLGEKLTKGLGAGADPEVGREAALESIDIIRERLNGADMVFVTAGMGGGTGTGAAPVIAEVAKEMGALTVGVITKPFYFEGKRRLESAERGIKNLADNVDSLITIPNDRLLSLASKKATFLDMLKKADEVLYYAVKSISDLIMVPGLINLDFADVKAVMSESGLAMMGTGIARGESRAREAAMKAITSPLLEDVNIEGARGVLMNVTCGPDLAIDEVAEAASIISEAADEDANIYFGTVFEQEASDEMRITVIATGIENTPQQQPQPASENDPLALLNKLQGGSAKSLRNKGGASAKKTTAAAPEAPRPVTVTKPATTAVPPMSSPSREERLQRGREFAQNDPDLRTPAYLRRGTRNRGGAGHNPQISRTGQEDFVFDEDDFETPAFLRAQAD
ncbi:cell division protein FtsZ [Desulfobaculum bizertense]|uniref:Cell division protein FtsZ n=1 Tax=Desulfobaculum bizertense DSM 18034 TaxID=1121442 RepID=A0A1T4VXI6_9BACT|nr:cell division protein FtsZ [Desulfobaculum bizertense]UIJ36918.1 cell division protein FtsZ [Desulfobaculum bizertense]SKA69647.1 cell division protein FtsZ [Desulfobaculum bizertense DSM 18034]